MRPPAGAETVVLMLPLFVWGDAGVWPKCFPKYYHGSRLFRPKGPHVLELTQWISELNPKPNYAKDPLSKGSDGMFF